MSVKAQWHTAGAVVPTRLADPFADDEPVRVMDVGIPVDIDSNRATLDAQLAGLIEQESTLFNAGVTCAVKDNVHTSCFACPLFAGATTADRAPLCRLGREQERVLTHLAVHKSGLRRQ